MVYLQSSGRLIGLTTGEIKTKNIQSYDQSKYEEDFGIKLAKHVLQIFYVSTDARVSFPLAYFPISGLSGEDAFNIISKCIEELKKCNGID